MNGSFCYCAITNEWLSHYLNYESKQYYECVLCKRYSDFTVSIMVDTSRNIDLSKTKKEVIISHQSFLKLNDICKI